MGITIQLYREEHIPAVKAFNERLRAGGAAILFPESNVPAWLPPVEGREIFHEYFLAVEDEGAVRGAYIFKHQPFFVSGQVSRMTEYRLPLAEGQVDKQFASVGVQIYLDAMRRGNNLYTVGIGGYQEAAAQMLVRAGWKTWLLPFYFRVLHPTRFLRNIEYLRRTPARRAALDALAISGLGTLGVHAVQAWRTRKQPREAAAVQITAVEQFGPWADEIWQASQPAYTLMAVRDSTILNILYPTSEPRWVRLRVDHGGETVGWAVVLNVPMQGHNYFGDMRVGSLIDCLAVPGMESKVSKGVMQYLREHAADVVVTNLSHVAWRQALEAAGLHQGPSNFIFAASKKVAQMLEPFDANKERIHMTRGDGGGPQNLLTARGKHIPQHVHEPIVT